jgi:hypothetical protein
MFQPSSKPTQDPTAAADPDAALLELDGELVRQNAELAEALQWLRDQGEEALPLDVELLEQIAELDQVGAQARATNSPSVPDHSTRC